MNMGTCVLAVPRPISSYGAAQLHMVMAVLMAPVLAKVLLRL